MSELGYWPDSEDMDVRVWLSNFANSEREFALDLLQSLVVIGPKLTVSLFRDAYYSVSQSIFGEGRELVSAREEWARTNEHIFVSYITKERPHPAQSGYSFARLTRDKLEIDPSRILSLENLIPQLYHLRSGRVLLVDDVVGSGDQCKTFWHRKVEVGGVGRVSLSEVVVLFPGIKVHYFPLIATAYGLFRAKRYCRGLEIRPVNTLSPIYRANHKKSKIWRSVSRLSGAKDFIGETSRRASIPPNRIWGHHQLGLCLTFERPPDISLPIFYAETENWKPLIKRIGI